MLGAIFGALRQLISSSLCLQGESQLTNIGPQAAIARRQDSWGSVGGPWQCQCSPRFWLVTVDPSCTMLLKSATAGALRGIGAGPSI